MPTAEAGAGGKTAPAELDATRAPPGRGSPRPRRSKHKMPNAGDLHAVAVVWRDSNLSFDDGALSEMRDALVWNVTLGFLSRKRNGVLQLIIESSPEENTVRFPYNHARVLIRKVIPLGRTAADLLAEGRDGIAPAHCQTPEG